MTSTRRDMLTLLPIAMAPAALPPAILPSPAVCSGHSPDAALITKCEEFIRADQARMALGREMENLREDEQEPPAELHLEHDRLKRAVPNLDDIGEVPAVTIEGLKAKARAQLAYLCRHEDGRFEDDERMIGGILLDLLRLT